MLVLVLVTSCHGSSWLVTGQLGPALVEEVLHVLATFTDRRIIFVENLAILKDHTDIFLEFIFSLVYSIVEFLPDGGDVHGNPDDFLVSWKLLGVDRGQEGPGVLVTTKF